MDYYSPWPSCLIIHFRTKCMKVSTQHSVHFPSRHAPNFKDCRVSCKRAFITNICGTWSPLGQTLTLFRIHVSKVNHSYQSSLKLLSTLGTIYFGLYSISFIQNENVSMSLFLACPEYQILSLQYKHFHSICNLG